MSGQGQQQNTGALGEELAARYLRQQGYRVLARNFRHRYGEIDIIAEKGGVTYFVEVKAKRSSAYAPPRSSVDQRKRRQIAKIAALWFAQQGRETDSSLLVAEVRLDSGEVELIEDFLC